jgi:hypothetical protein
MVPPKAEKTGRQPVIDWQKETNISKFSTQVTFGSIVYQNRKVVFLILFD